MILNYLIEYLLGIFVFFVGDTASRVAIVGGEKALEDQFPYQVSVQSANFVHHCGGGIIGDRFILTVAHCVVDLDRSFRDNQLSILAGSNDRGKTDSPAVRIDVVKVYVPAEYHPKNGSFVGDLAVLKLKHPLAFSKHIKALQVPKNIHEVYSGKSVIVAGWGYEWIKIENNTVTGGNTDNFLRFTKLDVIEDSHRCYHRPTDSQKQLCARVKQHRFYKSDAAVCVGDSGSPLVLDAKTVIGVLSTGPYNCQERDDSGLYTRISHYSSFIHYAMHDITDKDVRCYTYEAHPESHSPNCVVI